MTNICKIPGCTEISFEAVVYDETSESYDEVRRNEERFFFICTTHFLEHKQNETSKEHISWTLRKART